MRTFEIWHFGAATFMAIPSSGKVHILDDNGNNYGAWYSIDSFRNAQKKGEKANPPATPIGRCRPIVTLCS